MRTPAPESAATVARAWAAAADPLVSSADSAISIVNRDGSRPPRPIVSRAESANSGCSSCLAETFTYQSAVDPCRVHAAAWATAASNAHSPSGTIRLVCSAKARNSSGARSPRAGSSQRTRASSPTVRPSSRLTTGCQCRTKRFSSSAARSRRAASRDWETGGSGAASVRGGGGVARSAAWPLATYIAASACLSISGAPCASSG